MAIDDPEIGNGGADPKLPSGDDDPAKREPTPEEKEWQYQVGAGPKPGSLDPALPAVTPAAPPMAAPSPADAATLALVGGHLKVNASLATQEGIAWLIGLLRQTSIELFEEVDAEMQQKRHDAMSKPAEPLSSSELLGGKLGPSPSKD